MQKRHRTKQYYKNYIKTADYYKTGILSLYVYMNKLLPSRKNFKKY